MVGDDKDSDEDGTNTDQSPEDGKSLTIKININIPPISEEAYFDMGQPLIHKRRNNMAQQCNRDENEISLPSLKIGRDTLTGLILKHIQTLNEEKRSGKVYSKRDGDITSNVGPTTDPGRGTAAPVRRQGEGLVVDATGGRVDGGDLGQRGTYTQHNERDDEPAPNHVCGAAADDGVGHGRR